MLCGFEQASKRITKVWEACSNPVRSVLIEKGSLDAFVNRARHFIAVDEPTNYLDVETVDALGKALAQASSVFGVRTGGVSSYSYPSGRCVAHVEVCFAGPFIPIWHHTSLYSP